MEGTAPVMIAHVVSFIDQHEYVVWALLNAAFWPLMILHYTFNAKLASLLKGNLSQPYTALPISPISYAENMRFVFSDRSLRYDNKIIKTTARLRAITIILYSLLVSTFILFILYDGVFTKSAGL